MFFRGPQQDATEEDYRGSPGGNILSTILVYLYYCEFAIIHKIVDIFTYCCEFNGSICMYSLVHVSPKCRIVFSYGAYTHFPWRSFVFSGTY